MIESANAVIAIVLVMLILVASVAIAAAAFVQLPVDYVSRGPGDRRAGEHRSVLRTVARNAAGVLLTAAGLFLAVPGIPGPGLLIAVAGLLLLDFPGKGKVLRMVARYPSLLRPINRLRRAYARPPLEV